MKKTYKDNELFNTIESSLIYRQFQRLTKHCLEEQWNDVLHSWAVLKIINKFWPVFQKKNEQEKNYRMRKAQGTDLTESEQRELDKEKEQVRMFWIAIWLYTLHKVLSASVLKSLKSVWTYNNYKAKTADYFKQIMTKGEANELANLKKLNIPPILVSKEFYRIKIRERAKTLIKWLDTTTSKKIAKQLILWMDKGENKTQILKRLRSTWANLSETRAKQIAVTETSAALEFSRNETAKANKLTSKVWATSYDEKTCHICNNLADKEVWIDKDFPWGLSYPPAHINCRCYAWYNYTAIPEQLEILTD